MDKARTRRLAALSVALVLALMAAVFYKANPITNGAQRYASSVAAASAGVYITLRSLNAFLSTAQEVEVGGSLVVSGTAQPLKVLEPIDDTIERIAAVVFFVMVATGVMAVAMGPVGAVGFAMIAMALAIGAVQGWTGRGRAADLAQRLGWYGVFLGLALPMAFVLAALVADHLTNDVWVRHSMVIGEITAQVETGAAAASGDTGGWFPGLQSALGEVDRYQEMAQNIYARADDLIASFIAILAVFLFKVIVLPALLMGAFLVVVRFFAHQPRLA